jgi:4-hydroxy-L-threonine phosphate dehydrogenase PdxA
LRCLDRHAGGRIALAGLNPHAGEGGLLGTEEGEILQPAVARAREAGIDVAGPESADSLFARAARGEFDWVLALYHDQGLIPVKTAAFGLATNWTVGLPFLRTSVDHGTAFGIAGSGRADERPLAAAIATTLEILAGTLPRRRA